VKPRSSQPNQPSRVRCIRGWKEGRRGPEREGERAERGGKGDEHRGGAARVVVHSVASIMQRHGVFAFP